MIELLLEEPEPPAMLQADGIFFYVDAPMADILKGQHIFVEDTILYIDVNKYYSHSNAFSVNRRSTRQRLDLYIYESMNAYGSTINTHTQRLILSDGDPGNLTITNMRVERLPEAKLTRRHIA